MGLDLSVRKSSWSGTDQTWIGSQEGTLSNRSVTLDLSKFNFASTFTSGKIPSGVFLAKITASGLYGPYDDGLSNGQEVATGLLFTDFDVTDYIATAQSTTLTGKTGFAPMLIRGVVIAANLPTGNGSDANGKADLKFVQFI